jgi:hypothetical protein
MKVTITFERETLQQQGGCATSELHCNVTSGNGYVRHEQILTPGQAGSITYKVDERERSSSVTLEVTPIT